MRALVITVTADEVELASDALWALGVVAIEERVGPHGTIELWTSLGDEIGYDDIGLPTRWPWRLEDVDEAVSETWREFAEPIWVDSDLVVQPRWIEFDPPTGVTVLKIDPGVTFGMGDHPTTMLSLRALRRELTPGDRVLDVGCGSGVLAIAAMKFGAGSATAIDIAPAAVPVTLANAAANDVAVEVSTTPLAEITGTFEVVMANILAPTLVALAPDLRRVLAPGGALVISGVLEDAHQHVLDALEPLQVVATDIQDGWAEVTLR